MQDMTEVFTSPPLKHIDVGHSALAYRRVGSGPDVVFVHGWPVTSATWRGILPELSKRWTCHLLDLPGVGDTRTGPDAPYGLRAHGIAVARAVEALGLDRVAIVGHDSGGAIARYAAQQLGDRVWALALSGTEIPGQTPLLLRLFVTASLLPVWLWRAVLSLRWLRRSRVMLGAVFADTRHVDGDFARLQLEPLRNDSRMMFDSLQLLRKYDHEETHALRAVHAELRAPTLLLWGSDDPIFPTAHARRMAEQFAGPTRYEEIEGARTFVHEDFAEQFAERVDAHLRAYHDPQLRRVG